MAESSEVQALEKISTEVGESQIKIILSSQCIKAQGFLVDKLSKQIERQKEICNFISNSNFKLQTEIKQAELEIKSLIIAHETIKSGNTELKKELLLSKVKKSEIAERVSNGEKKYESLWLESKERYKSIPFVQNLLQATSNIQILKEKFDTLENQYRTLLCELKTKQDFFIKQDRDRIIELANYMVNILPNMNNTIRDKNITIIEMSNEIDSIVKDQEAQVSEHFAKTPAQQNEAVCNETKIIKLNEDWMNISTNNERDIIIQMPRLQFINSDFDALNARLDQIKIMKVEIMNTPLKRVNPIETPSELYTKKIKDDEFSKFFDNRNSLYNNTEKEIKDNTYSRRKLINILDDVHLDNNEAYNMVSKINFDNLIGVNMIGKDNKPVEDNCDMADKKEIDTIEEIDLTKSSSDKDNSSLLVPPTQFLDLSQEKVKGNSQQQVHMSMTEPCSSNLSQSIKTSQECINKKRVSFDLPLSMQEVTNRTYDALDQNVKDGDKPDETIDSQINLSLVSNESYSKMKDMILKKHNLDLSPQFTYAKNKMLQSNTDETIITSKFFHADKNYIDQKENGMQQITESAKEHENQQPSNIEVTEIINEEDMDIDHVIVSSPKTDQMMKADRSVTGLLFNHNTQGIPDSLNVSISTTGFEEGDTDFPHCIDTSLLLSPKADLPMPMSGDNNDVTSQEVPNFLSGLRKTGLSFFGQSAATEPKPDTNGQNIGSNFNFNFGGEQKTRGGLFSMFR